MAGSADIVVGSHKLINVWETLKLAETLSVCSQGCKTCIQSFFAFLVDIPKLVNGLKLNYNKVKPVAFISTSLEGSLYLLAKTSIICSRSESSMTV